MFHRSIGGRAIEKKRNVLFTILLSSLLLVSFSVFQIAEGYTFELQSQIITQTIRQMISAGLNTVGQTTYPTSKTVTSNGSVALTTAQIKFGTASASFTNINGSYINATNSKDFAFNSSNFTIEMWINLDVNNIYQDIYTKRANSTTQISVLLFVNTAGRLQLAINFNSTSGVWDVLLQANKILPTRTWVHVALVRNGDVFTLYQNGVAVLSTTHSGSISDDGSCALIGGVCDAWTVKGYIDEVRISNVARWTSNFPPPSTSYIHDANTVLLLHMDSTNGHPTYPDDTITGLVNAMKAPLMVDVHVRSISFYSHATGNFRLAIYSDTSGQPDTKLWESWDTTATADSWNTLTIDLGTPDSLFLNSGTYWLAWQWNSPNPGPSHTEGAAGDGVFINQPYDVFPDSWIGGTQTSSQWSIYINCAR